MLRRKYTFIQDIGGMMKDSKLRRVLNFIAKRYWLGDTSLTRKEFIKKFGDPNLGMSRTYETYLTYLKRAGFVVTHKPGRYTIRNIDSFFTQMTHDELYRKAYSQRGYECEDCIGAMFGQCDRHKPHQGLG